MSIIRAPNLEILAPRFEKYIERIPMAGCWLWLGAIGSKTGHGVIGDGNGRPTKLIKAHRLAWLLYRGAIPEGLCMLHKCDIGGCCNPEHLYIGTQQDNLRDSKERGKLGIGRNHGSKNGSSCKLTEAQVLLVRGNLKWGELTKLSKEWGVHLGTLSYARCGRRWKYLNKKET